MDSGEITYRQQRKYCGKARCRKCRDGIGHGPYWFAFHMVDGKTVQTYIGKQLPPDVQAAQGASASLLSARQLGRAHQRPLVGRDTEQQAMLSLLLAVEQGTQRPPLKHRADAPLHTQHQTAQCVLLLGEAGIGKTRLAEEVGLLAQQRGWLVLWGRTYLQESAVPYHLWIEVLRKAMTKANKRMLARNALALGPLLTLLPELQKMLATDAPHPGEQEQHLLWEAVYRLLTLMSERGPLLVILDDVQWADESSVKLLAYLSPRLKDYPLIVIATCREHELSPDHPLHSQLANLRQEHAVLSLPLSPLSNEQIGVIISAIPHLPEAIVQQIEAKAAGNPLFAEELARSLDPALSVPSTSSAAADTAFPLPDTITAVFDQRMERLSRACQQLLGKAAVLGNSFDFRLIKAMEARSSTDEDTILDLLEEALQAGVLIEEEVRPRIIYHFWHPLLVSHLYSELSATRRANLHRQAAGIVRQAYRGREDEGAATIVYHLIRGGSDTEQIVHYAELAGDRAYRLSAYREAVHYYRLAIDHRGSLPDNASPDEHLHLALISEQLGECLTIQGDYEEARRCYEKTLKIRSRVLPFTFPRDEWYEAQIDALLWSEIGWTWKYVGDIPRARQCCEHGKQVLQEASIVAGPAWAGLHYQQSYLCWQEGKYEEARSSAQEALSLFEETLSHQPRGGRTSTSTRLQRTLEGDPVDLGRMHTLLAEIATTLGQSAEATAHYHTALAIFEQHDRQREVANVCCNLGDLYLRRADHSLAQSSLLRALSIAERTGDRATQAVAFGNLGVLARRRGNLPEATAWYRRAITLAEQITDPVYISLGQSYLAAVLHEQGNLQEATIAIRRAVVSGRTISPCLGFALITLGWMRVAQVLAHEEGDLGAPGQAGHSRSAACTRLLTSACTTVQRALALLGLDAETRTEGELAQAHISLLLGNLETALTHTKDTLEEAQRNGQSALIARAWLLLGAVLLEYEKPEQAGMYCEQALEAFQATGMKVEWARAQVYYSMALLQRGKAEEGTSRQGLAFLQEAAQVFEACQARLDLQVVEHLLTRYTTQANS